MKLYLPTTTLNFNNILSSESISPKSFYEKRNYGYSMFNDIPGTSACADALILFSEKKSFDVGLYEGLEDHKLLIEIDTDESKLIKKCDGVYLCHHTLYLSPASTRFVLFSEKDKTVLLSLSDSSSETKLVDLYKERIVVETEPEAKYIFPTDIEVNVTLEQEVDNDIRLNKHKGLYYGYYIGAMLSGEPKNIDLINVLRQSKNLLHALQTVRLNGQSRVDLDRQINDLSHRWYDLTCESNSVKRKSLEILAKEGSEDQQLDELRVVIEEYEKKKKSQICLEAKINDDLMKLENAKEDESPNLWIDDYIEKCKKRLIEKAKRVEPDKNELPYRDGVFSSIAYLTDKETTEYQLCLRLINGLLSSKDYGKYVSTYNQELATEITKDVKAFYEESNKDWETCSDRSYLNGLRKHLKGAEFNEEWDNNLLSSISAVLKKGDDWNALWQFLQEKEMTDYRLAFAIYGELHGFASLLRDFTDILFKSGDDKYICDVYNEINGQLLGDVFMPISIGNADALFNVLNDTSDTISSKASSSSTIPKVVPINDKQSQGTSSPKQVKKKGVSKNKKSNDTLFEQHFVSDPHAWDNICDIIPKGSKQKLKDDLKWFQKQFVDSPNDREYYKDVDKDDDFLTIEKFCNLKLGNDDKNKPKAPYFSSELREQVKGILISIYGSRQDQNNN